MIGGRCGTDKKRVTGPMESSPSRESSPAPIPYGQIPDARTGSGKATGVWAEAGIHEVHDDWWIALSATPYVDYNLALLHGDTAVAAAPEVIERVTAAKVPAVIMLAGAGLTAAHALQDAEWVCTGALPFMARDRGPAAHHPDARELVRAELPEARRLAGRAFGVPDEVGSIIFADNALGRAGTRVWGVFDKGELRCCSVSRWEGGYSAGWGLSTDPAFQRSGYARRLLRASAAHRLESGPPIALLMATPEGQRLYEQEGYVTLEHWQIWSKRRWVLP